MPIRRPLIAILLAATVLGGAAACNTINTDTLTDGTTQDQPITEVHISGGSGDVTVNPDATVKGLNLIRTVHYRGTPPGVTYHVDGTVLSLNTSCGGTFTSCSIDYEVRIPMRGTGSGVVVTGSNSSGNIKMHGVGRVDVGATSGDLEVTDAADSVTLRSKSGNVTLANIGGNVNVDLTSGDVDARDLRGATTQIQVTSGNVTLDVPGTGDVTAHSTSGDIQARIPNAMCRVHADSRSGDTHVDVTQGTGHLIDLTATSGNVTVRAR